MSEPAMQEPESTWKANLLAFFILITVFYSIRTPIRAVGVPLVARWMSPNVSPSVVEYWSHLLPSIFNGVIAYSITFLIGIPIRWLWRQRQPRS